MSDDEIKSEIDKVYNDWMEDTKQDAIPVMNEKGDQIGQAKVIGMGTREVDDNGNCKCGCCHKPDHGPCPEFEEGSNGRCVYCDHGKGCHPGNPKQFNTPLGLG